jgi:hypothetical protein
LTLKEGMQVEGIPVPADARASMARPLQLLHNVDLQLRRVLSATLAADNASLQRKLATLSKMAAPLNHAFDAVDLQDCGSRQQ